MKKHVKIIALVLVLLTVLSCFAGCIEKPTKPQAPENSGSGLPLQDAKAVIEFTYTEAEFDDIKEKLLEIEAFALQNDDIEEIKKLEEELDGMIDHLHSQTSVASVLSYNDTTDTEAEETYNRMTEWYNDIVVLYHKTYRKLYDSAPAKEEIFEDWTEYEIEYMFKDVETIAEYVDRFSELSHTANMLDEEEVEEEIADILKEMISLGNLIADEMGYDNYFDYANEQEYSRDYNKEDIKAFRRLVKDNLVDNVDELIAVSYDKLSSLSNVEMMKVYNLLYESPNKFKTDYIAGYIDSHSGTTKTYLNHAFENENFMLGGENAASVAFCTYISDNNTPFMFFAKDRYTATTFVHELGHYYASLFNEGMTGIMDVNEIQSQANEMLFMNYLLENFEDEKVIDAAYTYYIYEMVVTVIAATIINDFEERIYTCGDVSGFTVEDFDNIMSEVLEEYGGEEFVSTYIFDAKLYWKMVVAQNPMYYISYATSGVAALSIMAIGTKDTEKAYGIYKVLCEEIDSESKYVETLRKLEIETPFTQKGFKGICDLIEIATEQDPSNVA